MKTVLNQKQQNSHAGLWDSNMWWNELLCYAEKAACLSFEEKELVRKSVAAEILAAIPFISNCREPVRTAVSHLTLFIASVRCRQVYNHKAGQSLAARLEPVSLFPGGDSDVVEAGMLLLELLSLNDHKEDLTEDIVTGKQNPLILELEYKEERSRILESYNNISSVIRERFKELYDRAVKASFWI